MGLRRVNLFAPPTLRHTRRSALFRRRRTRNGSASSSTSSYNQLGPDGDSFEISPRYLLTQAQTEWGDAIIRTNASGRPLCSRMPSIGSRSNDFDGYGIDATQQIFDDLPITCSRRCPARTRAGARIGASSWSPRYERRTSASSSLEFRGFGFHGLWNDTSITRRLWPPAPAGARHISGTIAAHHRIHLARSGAFSFKVSVTRGSHGRRGTARFGLEPHRSFVSRQSRPVANAPSGEGTLFERTNQSQLYRAPQPLLLSPGTRWSFRVRSSRLDTLPVFHGSPRGPRRGRPGGPRSS